MLTSTEGNYLHKPSGSGPRIMKQSLCIVTYMINKYFLLALQSAEKEGHSMYVNSLDLCCRNKRKLQVHNPRMEEELSGCQACSGWVRHSQATCSALHPTLINSNHYSFCYWHQVAKDCAHLTLPFLLSSRSHCVK